MAETKSPAIVEFLDSMSKQLFGRSRSESIGNRVCVSCGKSAQGFSNEQAAKEYTISGLCETCQDKAFGADGNYVNQD
jgi:hypothetical protein